VIPKGVLGPPPDDSAWPVLLDVHRTCEVTTKRTQDSWIEARASLFPGTSWTGWYELPAVPQGAATTTTDAMTIGRLGLEL